MIFTTYGGAVIDTTPTREIRHNGGAIITEPPIMVARLLHGRDAENAKRRLKRTGATTSEKLRSYQVDRVGNAQELADWRRG